jgi:hypothetical protein
MSEVEQIPDQETDVQESEEEEVNFFSSLFTYIYNVYL